MSSARLNLTRIEKGATYRHIIEWKNPDNTPKDLRGCTAKMHIREFVESLSPILILSTENGGISIDPSNGKIALFIHQSNTIGLTQESGVYDLEIYHKNGDVTRLIEGSIGISNEVTRG